MYLVEIILFFFVVVLIALKNQGKFQEGGFPPGCYSNCSTNLLLIGIITLR